MYKRIQINLTESRLKQLDAYSENCGLSRSNFIALLIYEYGKRRPRYWERMLWKVSEKAKQMKEKVGQDERRICN